MVSQNQDLPSLDLDRRQILKGGLTLGAGLVLGFRWTPGSARAAALDASSAFAPNAFVRIAADNSITVLAKHIEFGQGVYTGLASLVAEELDADWSQVRVESAPADAGKYANLLFGIQATGGSTAIANSWEQLRKAGATARAMLVAAAAERWQVAASSLTVEKGVVRHATSGRQATFGELAAEAAQQEVPKDPPLKDPKDFVLIGQSLPRVDVPEKAKGKTTFTIDVDLPDLLTALVAHPPRFGATVASFDAGATLEMPGVVEVVQVPSGVAVLAKGFWAARKGREALNIEWDETSAEMRGSEELYAEFRAKLDEPGLSARKTGDAEAALASADKVLTAEYEFPYLAHAPMETLDCVIQLKDGGCEMWAGSQLQTVDQNTVAAILDVPPEKVVIHTQLAGGSFGRRATPTADIASEAAQIAKAASGKVPIKLIWTREDDIRGGYYRPLFVQRLKAGLDANGKLVAWHQRLAGQSILAGTPFEGMVQDGIDAVSVEGARGLPYAIPNVEVDLHTMSVGVPVLWWRSVGHTHNGYSTETFLDEIALAMGRDPVDLRRELLREHPRHLGVLDLVAEKSGWGEPLPDGKARGIAVHESFSSFVAQVAEVSLNDDGSPKVERVVCAVDCGLVINPDNVKAQMEGGIGYGLGAALHNEIVLEEGRVRESNFNDYRSLRIHEMPKVEVYIVPSTEPPTGVGEPGVPPIAPAVANALLALTGEPIHRQPFHHQSKRTSA